MVWIYFTFERSRAVSLAVFRRPFIVVVQSVWDFWWRKWHWDRFLSQYLGCTLSVSFHKCSILTLPLPEGQTVEAWESSKNQRCFGNWDAVDRKQLHFFRPGRVKTWIFLNVTSFYLWLLYLPVFLLTTFHKAPSWLRVCCCMFHIHSSLSGNALLTIPARNLLLCSGTGYFVCRRKRK
jgi:hypothetical protein